MTSQEIVYFCFLFHMLRIVFDSIIDNCESIALSIKNRKFNGKFIAQTIVYFLGIFLVALIVLAYEDIDFSMIFS